MSNKEQSKTCYNINKTLQKITFQINIENQYGNQKNIHIFENVIFDPIEKIKQKHQININKKGWISLIRINIGYPSSFFVVVLVLFGVLRCS